MQVLTFDTSVAAYCEKNPETVPVGMKIVYKSPKALEEMADVRVLISGRVKADNLDLLPNLEMVIVPYTGYDGLDLEALATRGIYVTNTSAHGVFVAERGLALTLALRGKVVAHHIALAKGDWSGRYTDKREAWTSLRGKRVGIYGYGTIGKAYRNLIRPFGCEIGVLAYKDRAYEDTAVFDSLKDLCTWCDLLFIAVPLSERSQESVNEEVLSVMKDKYIVNVARGSVMVEAELYKALERDQLGGYASDVWFRYPTKDQEVMTPSEFPFETLKNVVMTPHDAGFEERSRDVRYRDVLQQVVAFLDGGRPFF